MCIDTEYKKNLCTIQSLCVNECRHKPATLSHGLEVNAARFLTMLSRKKSNGTFKPFASKEQPRVAPLPFHLNHYLVLTILVSPNMSRKAANSNKRSAETAFDMDDEFPFSSSQQLSLATTVSGPIKNATPTNYLVVSSLQVSHSNFEQDHEMDQSPATHKGSETSGPGSSSSSNGE